MRLIISTLVFLFNWGSVFSQTLEPRPLFVEGYTNQLSYAPGDEVALSVSTTAGKYSIEIARFGAKREVVLTKKDVDGKEHPTPAECSSHGCGWPASFKFKIPADWKSGYYNVALTAAQVANVDADLGQ